MGVLDEIEVSEKEGRASKEGISVEGEKEESLGGDDFMKYQDIRVKGKVTDSTLHHLDNHGNLVAQTVEQITDLDILSRIDLKMSTDEIIVEITKAIGDLTKYNRRLKIIPYCLNKEEICKKFLLHRKEYFFLYEARSQLSKEESPIIELDFSFLDNIPTVNYNILQEEEMEPGLTMSAGTIQSGFLSNIKDPGFNAIIEALKKQNNVYIQSVLSNIYIQIYLADKIPAKLEELCKKVPDLQNERLNTMTDVHLLLKRKVKSLEAMQAFNAWKGINSLLNKTFFANFDEYKSWMNESVPKLVNDFDEYIMGKNKIMFKTYIVQQMENFEHTFDVAPDWTDYLKRFKKEDWDDSKFELKEVLREIQECIQDELVRKGSLNTSFGSISDLALHERISQVNRIKDAKGEKTSKDDKRTIDYKDVPDFKSFNTDDDVQIFNVIATAMKLDCLIKRNGYLSGLLVRLENGNLNERDKKIDKLLRENISKSEIDEFLRRGKRMSQIKKSPISKDAQTTENHHMENISITRTESNIKNRLCNQKRGSIKLDK